MSNSQVIIDNITKLIKLNDTEDSNENFPRIKTIFEDSEIEVRVTKESELFNLYLLNSKKKEDLTPLQTECNGIILEKDTNKVICMCQNKFNEISSNPDMQLNQIEDLRSKYNKVRMEYCEDGTVIRLYNYNGKWYTATTRCIDARNSYWSSEKTFDDMFWEIFDKEQCNMLNINCTYIFILIHKENRIVVNHKYNNLIYVNCINNNTYEENFNNIFYDDDPKRCIRRTKVINMEEPGLINYPLDNYFTPTKRGIIIKFFDEIHNKWILYQYDFQSYNKVKNIRGNVPLIRIRYLELLNEPVKLMLLEQNYTEYKMLFTMIKHCLNNLYKEVHQLYYNSHIKHNITITEDHKFYRTLKQLHGHYRKNNVIITLDEVVKKINSLDKNILKNFLGWC